MDCIYLNKEGNVYSCHAQPTRPREVIKYYKPTDDELKNFCRKPVEFVKCPRNLALYHHLKVGGE